MEILKVLFGVQHLELIFLMLQLKMVSIQKLLNLSIIGVQPELISAIRLNVTCIASGQAAGIAAALNIPPYEVLRKELLRQNCLLAR